MVGDIATQPLCLGSGGEGRELVEGVWRREGVCASTSSTGMSFFLSDPPFLRFLYCHAVGCVLNCYAAWKAE